MPDGLPIHVDDVPAGRWEYGEVGATRRRLGVASGARRLGIAVIEIDPGKRSTPPHSHADEDEMFLVLAGGGLSYQTSVRTTSAPTGSVSMTCSGIRPMGMRTR